MSSNSLEVLKASFDLPLLTEEQEKALFRQFKEGGPDADSAREKLFLHNIRLVISEAKKRYPQIELGDRVDSGMIGLNTAINRFDLAKGCRFASFAIPWIRQAIDCGASDAITICGFTLPKHSLEDYYKAAKLIERGEVEPTADSIINHPRMIKMVKKKKTKMSRNTALILLNFYEKNGLAVPLDKKVPSKDGQEIISRVDLLPDKQTELEVDSNIDPQVVESLLSCLTDDQRDIVVWYCLRHETTLRGIAKQTGLSHERVQTVLNAGLQRMRRQAKRLGLSPRQLPR